MLRKFALIVTVIGISAATVAANVETISRVFTLQYVSVSEASTAVQPMLSEAGSLTLQPGLSRIVVQDQPEIIDRVTELIQKLDHLPGAYSVRFDLLEGGENAPYGSVLEVQVEDRVRRMFKSASFSRLGSSTIEGVFGSPARAELSSSFQISFLAEVPRSSESTPWGMRDPGNRLHLRQLVLERKAVADDGTVTTDELLRTNVLLAPKQTVYIGAGNSEDSEEVLVLIVHAEDFGSR
jgi:type II secretory pathway component GspD/PulD (secretin)